MSEAAASKPYLDLSRVSLPTQVKIDDRELAVASLDDRQKLVLLDLARLDKELNDLEHTLRVMRAAKAELTRLFTRLSEGSGGPGSGLDQDTGDA